MSLRSTPASESDRQSVLRPRRCPPAARHPPKRGPRTEWRQRISGCRGEARDQRPPTDSQHYARVERPRVGLVAMVAALRPSLPAYLAFLDACLTRRAACFARLDAGALAVLPGFATGTFLVTLTGAFNFGSAATAVSASAVTVARTCSRVRVQIELAVASDVSTPLPRTRIACVSTAEPSLISARSVLPASFFAHWRVTAAAPRPASQTCRDAATAAPARRLAFMSFIVCFCIICSLTRVK